VVVGDREICKTPCERFIDPQMPYLMRSDAGFLQQDHRAEVPDLRAYQDRGPIQVRAYPRSQTGMLGGIMLTTFGGLGVLTGAALTPIGFASDDKGMVVGGLVSLAVGAALLIPGILFLANSGSHADVSTQ
jgi:hypothetical protein